MKICIVAEGCYPYVVGGVSSWIHNMILRFPEHEFIVLAIVANREMRGQFKYEIPSNVESIYEMYLNDFDFSKVNKNRRDKLVLSKNEKAALNSMILGDDVDWPGVFKLFSRKNISVNDVLMGVDFLEAVMECYNEKYFDAVFSDFLWTMRSIYLPMFLTLTYDVPEADLYHCVATGYAGVLGAMAKVKYSCGLLVSEHGIYTREREEELIKADWVQGIYKNIWIDQFKKMSRLAYERANAVTCLYEHAKELQIELGCDPTILHITPNGVNPDEFKDIQGKNEDDKHFFNVAAVLRVTPIKDVKTMIRAFYYAKRRAPRLKLWIMGPTDEDEDYAKECFDMVESMGIRDIEFTGRIDVHDYLGRMDATILTSVSEGQPLTILEGFAAHLPAIATNVGDCRGLIYGENDGIGDAGILTHIMNVQDIADALVYMATHPMQARRMGDNGYRRLIKGGYTISDLERSYKKLYGDYEDYFVNSEYMDDEYA